MNTLPKDFKPASSTDFIGPAREIAPFLEEQVRQAKWNDRSPLGILIHGRPGVGKSALAEYFLKLLGCHPKWSTTKKNGTSVKIDTVEQIASSMHLSDMFSEYRALWIEEADAIPTVAQTRLLTLMDDLPKAFAVVLTSNSNTKDLEERFHTRFQAYEVKAPATHEIEGLLARWPALPEYVRKQIAVGCGGNVRVALLDANNAIIAIASQARTKAA